MGEVGTEPSMEEILSSIKRIIAEDSDAALAPPRARRSAAAPAVAETPSAETQEEVLELTETVAPEAEVAEPKPVVTKGKAAAAPEAKPALVSSAAAEASRTSLAALSALIVKPEIVGSDTLEGLVREMLKPMLAEWLEAKLPDVVERMVAREISRITDRG